MNVYIYIIKTPKWPLLATVYVNTPCFLKKNKCAVPRYRFVAKIVKSALVRCFKAISVKTPPNLTRSPGGTKDNETNEGKQEKMGFNDESKKSDNKRHVQSIEYDWKGCTASNHSRVPLRLQFTSLKGDLSNEERVQLKSINAIPRIGAWQRKEICLRLLFCRWNCTCLDQRSSKSHQIWYKKNTSKVVGCHRDF